MTCQPKRWNVVSGQGMPWLAAVLACTLLAGCGLQTNRATGKTMFSFMTQQQEMSMGHEVAEKSLKEYGGEYTEKPALNHYVSGLVADIVRQSERPDVPFQARVLDDPIMNAFAVPGHVMVARGILPFFQNEAQMMFVLGHEVGHVTAQHHVRTHAGQLLTTGVLVVASEIIARKTDASPLAHGAMQLGAVAVPFGFAYYSRSHELEADMLGVRYMSALNYPTQEATGVFRMFTAYGNLADKLMQTAAVERSSGLFHRALSSHPDDMTRITEAAKQMKKAPSQGDARQERYLGMIDGIAFGAPLKEGVVTRNRYVNPQYAVAFDLPEGFQYHGFAGLPLALHAQTGAFLDVKIVEKLASQDLTRAMQAALPAIKNSVPVKGTKQPVATGSYVSGDYTIRAFATLVNVIGKNEKAMLLVLVRTGKNVPATQEASLMRAAQSIRTIPETIARRVQPLRLSVQTVQAGETNAMLAQRLPMQLYQNDWFALLNGFYQGESVRAGMKVKMVTDPNASLSF